jgi:hypothetical protein
MNPVNSNPYLIILPKTKLAALNFKKGSAIVADKEDNHYILHYEGNVHGAVNLETFAGKLVCAAGRKATNYPTLAMLAVTEDEFDQNYLVAGTFDYSACRVHLQNRSSTNFTEEECVERTCTINEEIREAFQRWTQVPAAEKE